MTNKIINIEFVTISEAINLINKKEPTIRKLIQAKKIDFKKVKGKRGQEIRINKQSLLNYYPEANINVDKKESDINKNINIKDELIEQLKKQVEDKNNDIEFLQNQIKEKDSQIGKTQNLLENEQKLNLQNNFLQIQQKQKPFLEKLKFWKKTETKVKVENQDDK